MTLGVKLGTHEETLIVDTRRVVGDLGIPQEAIVFEKQKLVRGQHYAWEPLLRPVIDSFKRLFRSEDENERPITFGPGRC